MARKKREETYFGEQLAGETPLGQSTAERLCGLAERLGRREPWRVLSEDELIAVQWKRGGEPDFVSVMGEVGEFRAIAVYPGLRGFAWLQAMAEAEGAELRRVMMTERLMVMVEYPDEAWELTDSDRELTQGCGVAAGTRPFVFRAVRPGYSSWYITEEEGVRLAGCLEALEELLATRDVEREREELWPEDSGAIPLLQRAKGRWEMRLVALQVDRVVPPELWIGEDELAGVPAGRPRGEVCVGSHLPREMAGMENERPMFVELVAAVDGRSGLALKVTVAEPGHWFGETLSRVLVEAFRERGAVAEAVYVPARVYADLLREMGRRVGFEVRVRERNPKLEEFFAALDARVERDRGPGSKMVH